MYRTRIWVALALFGGLVACGDNVGEQALFGGAVGVGTAAVVNGDLATGAVAGAAANIIFCQINPGQCN